LLLVSIFYSSCGFPYHTKQARNARKAQRLAKKKKQQAPPNTLASKDSTLLVEMDSTQDSTTLAPRPTDTTRVLTPTDTLLVPTDSIPSVDSVLADADSLPPLIDTATMVVDSTSDDLWTTIVPSIDSLLADSNIILLDDSLEMTPDSSIFPKKQQIFFSKDSLTMPVQYEAADSMIYDIVQRKVYMFGNAQVFYEQYELKAGYIEFDFRTNVAMATCLIDSAGNEVQCPLFDDKQQTFDSRRIEFNFKSKKGKVYDASTQQGDGYLVSNATKFISGDSDSNSTQNIIYSQGCIYTTCDHEHPHFGIRASKAKIIPNKLIVVGPSFLEIMGSPTPIVLPFGFFPLTKNKRSGLILSTDFDFSPTLGPGLRGNGFYLGLSEYWDLKVTGDFYMRGSFLAYVESNYNIRYKGNGNVKIRYTRIQIDQKNTPDFSLRQSFNFSWSHTQSPKAHPNQTFSASVNFGTSDYYQNTFNDANSVLQATFNSNISYTKRFTGSPFSLSARLSHSQNTQTRQMTINFPQLTLNMNQIYPFKRKKRVGKSKWYERIGFSYTMSGRNEIRTSDTTFFTSEGFQEAIDNMNYDITHSPRINMSFKLFKYINLQPSINYTQKWFFYRNREYLDPTPVIDSQTSDTTSYGTVEDSREYGFYTTHQFSAGVRMNTQIYATGQFNIGPLHQIRGTFTPSVGFSWRPSYENAYDYFYDSVQTDSRYPNQLRRYNYFAFSPPAGRTANLTYSLNARFEAKVKKGKRDSTLNTPYKKIVLIPNVSLNGSYNMAADSLHFSPINFNTYTTLFKKINVRFSATFDPYTADPETNRRINTFEYTASRRLLRVTTMSFNASTSLNAKDLRSLFRPKNKPYDSEKKKFDLIKALRLNYNFVVNNQFIEGVDSTVVVAHQLSVSGTVNLSKGWAITIGRIGYDFSSNRVTYPDFTFSRDLHCWQMGLSWQPERRTWSFFIRVKPGSLSFLNIPVKKEFYDQF